MKSFLSVKIRNTWTAPWQALIYTCLGCLVALFFVVIGTLSTSLKATIYANCGALLVTPLFLWPATRLEHIVTATQDQRRLTSFDPVWIRRLTLPCAILLLVIILLLWVSLQVY